MFILILTATGKTVKHLCTAARQHPNLINLETDRCLLGGADPKLNLALLQRLQAIVQDNRSVHRDTDACVCVNVGICMNVYLHGMMHRMLPRVEDTPAITAFVSLTPHTNTVPYLLCMHW